MEKIYPLPQGEEEELPARRLDGQGLVVWIAVANTEAADDLLIARLGGDGRHSARKSGVVYMIFQDKKGLLPLECSATLEKCRALLEA